MHEPEDCTNVLRIANASRKDLEEWYTAQAQWLVALIRMNGGSVTIPDHMFEEDGKMYRIYYERTVLPHEGNCSILYVKDSP